MGQMGKVVPSPMDDPCADESTQPFWDAALLGKLTAAKCAKCGTCHIPSKPRCFVCQHDRYDWIELSGEGSIYSFTIVRHPLRPDLRDSVPYVAAVVEPDGTQGAGARMILNVIDCDVDEVRIGDRGRIIFDKISPTLAVPRFTLGQTA